MSYDKLCEAANNVHYKSDVIDKLCKVSNNVITNLMSFDIVLQVHFTNYMYMYVLLYIYIMYIRVVLVNYTKLPITN